MGIKHYEYNQSIIVMYMYVTEVLGAARLKITLVTNRICVGPRVDAISCFKRAGVYSI